MSFPGPYAVEIIHTLPTKEDLQLAELTQQHAESEADEIVWREHMAKLKTYTTR